MAVVDINTGKIVGCKRGSLTWWHEKGHLVYNRSNKGIINSYRQFQFLIVTISLLVAHMFLPIIFFKIVGGISFIIWMLYFSYEEIWCWVYAWKKKS